MAAAAYAVAKQRLECALRYLGVTAAIAAVLYPIAFGRILQRRADVALASGCEGKPSAWLVTLGAALLVYGIPAVSFRIIYWLGHLPAPRQAQVRARAWTHLASAYPPLFTAIGVLLYLLHSSSASRGSGSGRLC